MDSITNQLGTAKIGKLLLRLSIPAITAQLVNVLYNIVDRAYIGNIPENGATAIAGLGITMPVIVLITAFSSLVGMGGAPLASIELGAKRDEGAQHILNNCFMLLLILAAVLMVLTEAFAAPLLRAFGASDVTLPYAESYLRIYALGTFFVMITMGMNSFINAQGFSATGMWTVIIGAVCNLILDPVFIFGLKMGVKGAALATILSQGVSCVWVMFFLTGKKTRIRLKPSMMRLKGAIVGRVTALGLSPFVMQSTESLVQIVINTGLARYSGDMAVASMTIIMSVMQVMNMPLQGLGQGAQPIISYNYGARDMRRVKKTFRLLITASFSLATFLWLMVQLFPHAFIFIFSKDADLTALTVRVIRIFLAGTFAMGAQFAVQQTFLSVGQARTSIFIAMLRKIILLIPLALVLPRLFNLGAMGIYLAEPIADITCAAIACTLFAVKSKKLFAEPPKEEEHGKHLDD